MANLADEYGTDVEIYIKALTTTIHADTPTGAPAQLHDLLEHLGLERHEYPADTPIYTWHTVPEHLDAGEQKRLATAPSPSCSWPGTRSTARLKSSTNPPTGRPCRTCAPERAALPCGNRHRSAPPRLQLRPAAPRKAPAVPAPRRDRPPHHSRPGDTRSNPHTPTDQQPAQAPTRHGPLPPLSARLYYDRPRPHLPAGRRPPGGRPRRDAARRAPPPPLTVHRPGGACPTPPPTR